MLILASRSAARKSLLSGAGLAFETAVAGIDERAVEEAARAAGKDAAGIATHLAVAKAVDVSRRHPAAWVIGADQTLGLGHDLLHKPASFDAARAQLDRLAGQTHALHAGAALARNGQVAWSALDSAELTMRAFGPAERDAILALEGAAALDSVGAYRLEGPSIRLFESVRGDYFTILGLPLLPLLAALRAHAPELMGGFT